MKQGDHYGETMLLGLEQVWRVSLVSSSSSTLPEMGPNHARKINHFGLWTCRRVDLSRCSFRANRWGDKKAKPVTL